jgi:hypothetical protein
MNLSPEIWHSLSSLLDQALDLAPDGRAAWLEGVARTQPTLVPTLVRLLEAHASGEDDGPSREIAGRAVRGERARRGERPRGRRPRGAVPSPEADRLRRHGGRMARRAG